MFFILKLTYQEKLNYFRGIDSTIQYIYYMMQDDLTCIILYILFFQESLFLRRSFPIRQVLLKCQMDKMNNIKIQPLHSTQYIKILDRLLPIKQCFSSWWSRATRRGQHWASMVTTCVNTIRMKRFLKTFSLSTKSRVFPFSINSL